MLHNVPSGISRLARNVVLNHPNAWDCEVYRKVILRQSDAVVGGVPTLGGLGVLDSSDEDEIRYEFIGHGHALQVEMFSPSEMMDQQDANNSFAAEVRFLIEANAAPGRKWHFEIKKHDIVYLPVGSLAKIAFEVVSVETPVNISPFAMRYTMNRRGDLDVFDNAPP